MVMEAPGLCAPPVDISPDTAVAMSSFYLRKQIGLIHKM
jgi:hypothetical protein